MVKLREIFEDLSNEISMRKISAQYSISRQVVKKYKEVYEDFLEKAQGDKNLALLNLIRTDFTYKSCERTKRALTEKVTERIEQMLEENETLKRTPGMKKLVKRNKTICRILKEEGYKVSYSSVCSYIAKKKDEPTKSEECYIRIHHLPGEEVEFDWGEFSLYIGGVLTKIQMATFTLCYSNYRVVYLYTRQDMLAFNDAHVRFFREIGGVPRIMIYDNMRLAVKSFKGLEKELTENIKALSEFYSFKIRLCNIRSGNEKGQVERTVDVARQFVFATKYKFDSFEEAVEYKQKKMAVLNTTELSQATEGIVELTKVDIETMKNNNPYKEDMPCFEVESYSVDKYSTISFRGSRYSVPDHLVGKTVDVKIFATEIEIKYEGVVQVKWNRALTNRTWVMDINHYLKTLMRKPGAVHQSEVLHQAPEIIKTIFEKHFKDSPKQFIELLIYARDKNINYETLSDAYSCIVASEIIFPKYEHYIAYLSHDTSLNMEIPQEGADMIDDNAGKTLDDLTELMNGGNNDESTRA